MSDGVWFAKQAMFLDDPAIVELGAQHGPGGPLVVDALLGLAKLARKGGSVTVGYTGLARRTFLGGGRECREIIESAARFKVLEVTESDEVRCTVRFPRWEKWQSAFRQQRFADRQQTVSEPSADHQESVSEPSADRQQTVSLTVNREQNSNTSSLRSDVVEPGRLDVPQAAQIAEVFAYWQDKCNHPQAKLKADRKRKVLARLREGYTVDEIKLGVDGAAQAPFVAENGRRFDDLELICRNSTKLEGFMERAHSVAKDTPAALYQRLEARKQQS
jgi:hypothetical protein